MTQTTPSAEAAGALDFHAEVRAGLGGLGRKLDRMNRRLETPPPAPVYANPSGSVVLSAAGAGVIDIGGPAQGFVWSVRRVIIGGVTRDTSAAGIADLYVARSLAEVTAESIFALRDSTNLTTLPAVAFYGDEQIVVQDEERLYVMIQGGTASQTMAAVAGITQFQEGNRAQVVDVG